MDETNSKRLLLATLVAAIIVLSAFTAMEASVMIIPGPDPTPDVPTEVQVYVDIKPSSCPNPLNLKSGGVMPVAVLGTEDFDVTAIDVSTIQLNREGFEEAGVVPIRWCYEDVATPYEGTEECGCHDLNGDGYMDLTLKFDKKELIDTLRLSDKVGDTIPLTVTGVLNEDGTAIEGEDCVWVLKNKK